MKGPSTALALLTAVLACSPGRAADVRHGQDLGQRWCTSCHLVAPGQPSTMTEAPPFASVANRPDFDAARLALFLLDPHPKMPNMSLTRAEAADLAAYIGSLAK